MSFAKFTPAAALLAVLLFAATAVMAEVITSNKVETGTKYRAATQDFSDLTTFIYVKLDSCYVSSPDSGAGLTIAGKANPTASDVGLYYRFAGGTITAPVMFTTSIMPNSVFLFSGATAAPYSTFTSMFMFMTGTFVWNTTFTFDSITATWPSSGTGSLVSVGQSLEISGKSAIFIERCSVTNGYAVLTMDFTSASGPVSTVSTVITGNSVLAVDETTCNNCQAGIVLEGQNFTLSDSSLFRVRSCNAGSKLLVYSAASVTVSNSSLYAVTDSSSTDKLFLYPTSLFSVSGSSVVAFRNLTGGSTGLSSSTVIPTSTASDSYVYGDDACQFGGTNMLSTSTFSNNWIKVNQFISSTTCDTAECIPGASSGASGTDRNSCTCNCASNTNQHYCTSMTDPLYRPLSNAYSECTLFQCAMCLATNTSACVACGSGYVLSDTKQCVAPCTEAHCSVCNTSGICTSCTTGYILSENNTCETNCTTSPCSGCTTNNTCSGCVSGYSLYNGGCIPCSVDGCETCQSANICQACRSGFMLKNNQCSYSCPIPNCETCDSNDICAQCQSGFMVVSGYCWSLSDGASSPLGVAVGFMGVVALLLYNLL